MNRTHASEIEERRFAWRIRTALDASAHDVPADIAERLAAARRIAVVRRPAELRQAAPGLAPAGFSPRHPGHQRGHQPERHPFVDWLRRLGLVWTLVALGAGLTGIYHWQQEQRIDELADVEAAMLLDDLPPAAYADPGFHVFLKHGE